VQGIGNKCSDTDCLSLTNGERNEAVINKALFTSITSKMLVLDFVKEYPCCCELPDYGYVPDTITLCCPPLPSVYLFDPRVYAQSALSFPQLPDSAVRDLIVASIALK
jgi:hypothetical protein